MAPSGGRGIGGVSAAAAPIEVEAEADEASATSISVIMPVWNGADMLDRSLPPLALMHARGEVVEIIVVDDGSTDDSVGRATTHGARVLPSGGRLGPGGARNVAAPLARGNVLWFVDADVVVHDDAARILAGSLHDRDTAAVFGCYDDRPAGSNFLSQYKNLVHHYYHHRAGGAADTFWAGCGAVRKAAFLAAGGFDAARYPFPSIEDIELGYRLRERGHRIRLDPALQGTHLKVWRFANLLHTDVVRRALPWSRLILDRGALPDALNVGTTERCKAALAILLAASIVLAVVRLVPFWLPLLPGALAIAASAPLFGLFRRAHSTAFALAALAFHQLYYLYSAAAFAACWVEHKIARWRGRDGGR
ncbi:MAG: glycosyltransferase [Casimicrobiaceae bacterium]